MIEVCRMRNIKPEQIMGRVRLDLKNPRNGKVIERVEGKNHIFVDTFFGRDLSSSYGGKDYVESISKAWMCLNDDPAVIDMDFPYLKGQTIGYGRPSQNGSGLYRGAYNAANQVLASCDSEKIRWVFQYDFTTAQANGTIRNVGLTKQYAVPNTMSRVGYRVAGLSTSYKSYTCDGTYNYTCDVNGVITRYNNITGAIDTISVASVTGTGLAYAPCVGYAPSTGKGYVYVYSATTTSRKMYVFSDMAFTTLENTYTVTNWNATSSMTTLYIHGTIAYQPYAGTDNSVRKLDFGSNLAPSTLTFPAYNNAAYLEDSSANTGNWQYATSGIPGTSLVYLPSNISNRHKSVFLDLSSENVVATAVSSSELISYSCFKSPLAVANKLMVHYSGDGGGSIVSGAALTTYVLPSPVTKTSANGLTATYEVEVYW